MILLHGIASRHDLPLPFGLVVAAGAAALVITFWVALFAWRSPRYREESGTEQKKFHGKEWKGVRAARIRGPGGKR